MNVRGGIVSACLCLFFISIKTATYVHAQEILPELQQKTLIAGYKSVFTCSATFNAGRKWRDIKQSELHNVYPDYRPFFDQIPDPVINKKKKYVSTKYDDDMPPRISVWRPLLGCTALPAGATLDAISQVPTLKLNTPIPDQTNILWPDGDRLPNASRPENINKTLLDKTVTAAFDLLTYGKGAPTSAIVVVYKGKIIAEKYRDDFDIYTSQRTWSAAKSIAASVIGVAVQKGILNIHAPVSISEWQSPGDPRAKITLENLLHMSSGLWSTGSRTDFIYFGGGTITDHAVTNPLEAPPGRRWKYANNDTLLAIYSLRTSLGDDSKYLLFPFRELLFRIGMLHTVPETDWQGNFILSSQVWSTARDLARLGMLYLDNGKWHDEQLLPDWWAEYVKSSAPAQPQVQGDGPQRGYGAQFWLYRNFPGLPDDTHAMLGNRGQIVMLIPSRQLVVVRRGYDSDVQFKEAAFAADVLRAIK